MFKQVKFWLLETTATMVIRATTRTTKTATAIRKGTKAKATTASVITARVKAGATQARARDRGTKTRSRRAWSEPLQVLISRLAERCWLGACCLTDEEGRPSRWKDGLARSFVHGSTHHFKKRGGSKHLVWWHLGPLGPGVWLM